MEKVKSPAVKENGSSKIFEISFRLCTKNCVTANYITPKKAKEGMMSSAMIKDELVDEFTSRLVNSGKSRQEMFEALPAEAQLYIHLE